MGKNKRTNNEEPRADRNQQEGAERKAENKEEFAQDITPAGPGLFRDRADRRADDADAGRGLGITAIILSVLAFFLWPYILAPAGIIVGVISARRGSSLGWWAVGIGVIALIIMTFALPFRILF